MSRNFYILAATILFFSLVSFVLVWTNSSTANGSAGDAALWKTIALVLMMAALMAGLFGTICGMFEQTQRRHQRDNDRQREKNRH
jgi:uncharacterized membrane protein